MAAGRMSTLGLVVGDRLMRPTGIAALRRHENRCAQSRSARGPSAMHAGTRSAVRRSHGARIRPARHARCRRARATNAAYEKPSARWPVRCRVDSPAPVRRHPRTPCTRRIRRGRRRTRRRRHSPRRSRSAVVDNRRRVRVAETEQEQRRTDTEQRDERGQQQGLRHRRGERFVEERGQLGSPHLRRCGDPAAVTPASRR